MRTGDDGGDDETKAPHGERGSGPPGPASPSVTPRSWLAMLGSVLLFLMAGLVAVLLASVLVVYVTALAARRLGLPELPVTLTFLGLSAILVVALVGANIAARIEGAGERLTSAVDDAADRLEDAVSTSTEELLEHLDETPVMLVAEAPGGTPPHGKRPRRGRN